jgi:hypothetical protein
VHPTDATGISIDIHTSTFVWRRIGIGCALIFRALLDSYMTLATGVLRSVYIAARYGAMLNLELEAILDEFMLW